MYIIKLNSISFYKNHKDKKNFTTKREGEAQIFKSIRAAKTALAMLRAKGAKYERAEVLSVS